MSTILNRLVGTFQGQPVLRNQGHGLGCGHAEKRCIKLCQVALEKVRAPRVYYPMALGVRMVKGVDVEPILRYLAEGTLALGEQVPQLLRVLSVAREASGYADNGNGHKMVIHDGEKRLARVVSRVYKAAII